MIDARFPYESAGGHMKSALNLYKEAQVSEYFLRHPPVSMEAGQNICVLFHCEFSQPMHLLKRLRRRDRDVHGWKNEWLSLFDPEMSVMAGGYKEFYWLYGPAASSAISTPSLSAEATKPTPLLRCWKVRIIVFDRESCKVECE